ncbi:MAG: DUF4386 domain-containing protein [Bacteroidales bacterium]|nr:MAG: DUF4386 domain-containing protein [Bacteroidales bacterium]
MNSNKLTIRTADLTLRKSALIAGISLLVMTVFVIIALSFIFQKLIVPEDAGTTIDNIITNVVKFRFGIFSYLIVILCDVVVALALYVFLKPVNNSLSLLAAWFRLIYSIIFGIALTNYFNVLQLLSGADYLNVFETDQLHAQVMIALDRFNDVWGLGYVFFGLHLGLLGYLGFRSEYIPKVFGIILIIAGLSYLVDYSCKILIPDFDLIISPYAGWGELLFVFWLLIKGSRIKELSYGE